jgi:hypothetical protein
MKETACLLALALGLALGGVAQTSSPSASSDSPPHQQGNAQSNAKSATKDNSGISGDQVTKPAGAKSTSVIGCLSRPNPSGNFVLNSMQYRSGVEVFGPEDLKDANGRKVKLTGNWVTENKSDEAGNRTIRRFQTTSFEVMADDCPPPAEATPISKKKQQQREAADKEKSETAPK